MTPSASSPTSSGVAKPGARTAASKSKLRDCCVGCASSKVRCSKEKPACSRCLKRNVTCEYLASKRAGRKQDSSTGHASPISTACGTIDFNLNDMSNLNSAFSATMPLSTTASKDGLGDSLALSDCFISDVSTAAATSPLDESFLLSPPGLGTDVSLEATTSANVSLPYWDPFSPIESENNDSPSMSCSATGFSDDNKLLSNPFDADSMFNNALAADFNPEYAFDFDSSSNGDGIAPSLLSSPGALANDDLFGFSNTTHQTPPPELPATDDLFAFSDPTPLTPPPSPPAKTPKPINRPVNKQTLKTSHCACPTQALGLMKQLFPHPSTSSASGTNDTPPPPSSLPALLKLNKHTIQSVRAILACTCSQDVHLLSTTAHLVFKVLEWYELAARRPPPTPPATPNPGRGRSRSSTESSLAQVCRELERGGDSAAGMVLGELHGAQSLVNDLAAKLKTQSSVEQPGGTGAGMGDGMMVRGMEGEEEEQLLLPFSGVILDLLGMDLRKRYKEVAGMVDRETRRR